MQNLFEVEQCPTNGQNWKEHFRLNWNFIEGEFRINILGFVYKMLGKIQLYPQASQSSLRAKP